MVKIDPQSIGIGQYQHDVDQTLLKKALDREVESCVDSVGVDANTASPSLLSYVAGIGAVLAKRICSRFATNVGVSVTQRVAQSAPVSPEGISTGGWFSADTRRDSATRQFCGPS